VKEGGFRVNFIEVCEWFDGCDRLKIIFKSRKNKITKFSLILNMIKIIIINVWFVVEKNINMKYFIKNIFTKNVIKKFVINNYFLNLIL